MKKQFILFTLLFTLATGFAFAEPTFDEDKILNPQTLSTALGHYLARDLMDMPAFQFDMPSVVKGIQDELVGKTSPLTEEEYTKAFNIIQERYIEKLSTSNLNDANSFLENNLNERGVIELVPGKLQISVLKEGEGEKEVCESDTPLLQYTGKYLDETSFEGQQEAIPTPLNQSIPGLKKGLIGAKKGEQRRLFIHPELCNTSEDVAAPNSLMIIDVKVVETNLEDAQS